MEYFMARTAYVNRLKRCYEKDGAVALQAAAEQEKSAFLTLVKKEAGDAVATKFEDLVKNLDAKKKAGDEVAEGIITALKANLAAVEKEMKAFKENGGTLSVVGNSIKEQLKKQMTDRKEEFAKFKNKEQAGFKMTLKTNNMFENVAISSTGATNAYIPKPDIRPGYIDLVRNMPLIEQYANGGATSSPLMIWVDKYNALGTAVTTTEGTDLPVVSNQILTENSNAVLIGAYMSVSMQMLDDIDFMAAMIEQELKYKTDIAVDSALLTGAGTAGLLKGITIYAVGYTNTSITTTNANNFDAIRAIVGQMRNLNFFPTHVFVNPLDAANMDIVKDLYGRPIALEYRAMDGNGVDRVFNLILVESPQIAVGQVLVADMPKFYVFNLLPFEIQYGWINSNFIDNVITVTGIRRLHSFISTNHLNGFVYTSFATVKTALAPAP